MIEEDKAKAGPGTYKPPDYWEKIVYGSVAEPLRPSAMMEIKEKRDIYMYYDIPDYADLKKKSANNAIVSPYHSQRGKISSLLPSSNPPRSSSTHINMNVNSSPRRKLNQAISKSRMRGAKFPDSKLDFNYRGVPADTQFVRLQKDNGEVFIAPVCWLFPVEYRFPIDICLIKLMFSFVLMFLFLCLFGTDCCCRCSSAVKSLKMKKPWRARNVSLCGATSARSETSTAYPPTVTLRCFLPLTNLAPPPPLSRTCTHCPGRMWS